jgi:ribonuclease PH
VTIEEGVPRWMQVQKVLGGWLTAEYAMLPRATHTRTSRESSGASGRSQEIRRLIGRSLRSAIDLKRLGPRTITIDCDVLQADGGTRTASITGAYVALVLAIRKLLAEGTLTEDPLLSAVAAISAGIVDGEPLLDLCYAEDSSADADMNVVMNSNGDFLEIQATAEKAPIQRQNFDKLLALSEKGITALFSIQRQVLQNSLPQIQ